MLAGPRMQGHTGHTFHRPETPPPIVCQEETQLLRLHKVEVSDSISQYKHCSVTGERPVF